MNPDDPRQNLTDNVQNAFVYMYKHRLHTDVTFYIKSKGTSMCCSCFSAHKLVLAIISPVFADLFRDEGNKQSIIKNEVISVRGYDILLWYVYSGILDIQSPDDLAEASKAARYYQVKSLLKACKKLLLGCSIQAENVFLILEAAKHLDIDSKRKECLDLIERETANVIHTPGFLKADPETAQKVLQNSELSVDLTDLMEIVIKWIKHNKTTDKSLLGCLDFLPMSSDDFIGIARKVPDFFNQDEILKILANFIKPGTMEYPHWFTISSMDNNVTDWPGSYCDACNVIKESSHQVETDCSQRLWKSSLFERDGFEVSMALEIKLNICFPGSSCVVMLELAFGFTFVPEDCLDLSIYFCGLDLKQKKQRVKHCLISTPQHFYAVLDHKLTLETNRPLILMVEIKVHGLRQWGKNGPVSDAQYCVAMIPKSISNNVCKNSFCTSSPVSLIPLTEWIAFIDPKRGEKNFVITSLFFDTDSNHKKFMKFVGF